MATDEPEQPAAEKPPPAPQPMPDLGHQELVSMDAVRTPKRLGLIRGSTGDTDLDSVGKLAFLKAYLKQVRSAYETAQSQGLHDPIVFLVDCEDDVGGRLARHWLGDARVDEQIQARRSGERPGRTVVIVRPFAYEVAHEMVLLHFAYLSEVFPERPLPNEVAVFIVGLGGAASLFVPYRPAAQP